MRRCGLYTDRWKTLLGIILCFKGWCKRVLYFGLHGRFTMQNKRKNTFHYVDLRKNFRLSRHFNELSLGHRDAEIPYKRNKLLRVSCRALPMLSDVFIIIWLAGPLDYYLEDCCCVVTSFQRDLQNAITLVSLYEEPNSLSNLSFIMLSYLTSCLDSAPIRSIRKDN